MRQCSKCEARRQESDFYTRSSMCKACHRDYNRKWYERNREEHKTRTATRNAQWRKENQRLVRRLKKAPCTDCGRCYPYYVMEFDHLRDKKRDIHMMTRSSSPADLRRELEKCELVCANCHRERTFQRLKTRSRSSMD